MSIWIITLSTRLELNIRMEENMKAILTLQHLSPKAKAHRSIQIIQFTKEVGKRGSLTVMANLFGLMVPPMKVITCTARSMGEGDSLILQRRYMMGNG